MVRQLNTRAHANNKKKKNTLPREPIHSRQKKRFSTGDDRGKKETMKKKEK